MATQPAEKDNLNKTTPAVPGKEAPAHKNDRVKCPSCGYSFITDSNGKKKLRTRVIVFVENGNAMGICPKCRANLKVPVSLVEDSPDGSSEKEGRI
jgi:hypothetical protein